MTDGYQKRGVIVGNKRLVGIDTYELVLMDEDGRELPPVEAGAHLDLYLPNGLVRQYSIIDRCQEGQAYRIAVLRDPKSRGGSSSVAKEVKPGQRLVIAGPRNHFPLDLSARDYVLVAGGIGITPVFPMARRLAAEGKCFVVNYLVRSRERAAYLDEIEEADWGGRLLLHADEEKGVPDIAAIVGDAAPGKQVYVCGPGGLIDAVLAATEDWPQGQVHFERFAGVQPTGGESETVSSFEVELAQTGKTVVVGPDESILEAVEKVGVTVDAVCREGVCGSCMVDILEGEVDHRDVVQTPAEQASNEMMCVCVSRAKGSRIVLDL